MPDASNNAPDYVVLTCPDCKTQVTATRQFAGREISCPACLTSIKVPAREIASATPLADSKSADEKDDDSYRVAFFGTDTPPVETALLHPLLAKPKDVVVEEIETIALSKTPGTKSKPTSKEDDGLYTLGQQVERPPIKIEVFKALAEVKREKRPPPPKSLYFSNVFQFPWSTGSALVRWIYLSMGLTSVGLLLAVCVWLLETSGHGGWLGVGFLMMAIVWFGLWSLSFAAAVSVAVVTETASGMDRVEGWGEGGWRDWLFDFLLLLWLYMVSGFVGLLVAWPLQLVVGALTPQLVVVQFFVFPAIWLSAMDAETVWIPYSSIVTLSVPRIPKTWAKFFGLALALKVATSLVVGGAAYVSPWLGAIVGGPAAASFIFIYARLLGRLGYAVITAMEQPNSPRESKPKSPVPPQVAPEAKSVKTKPMKSAAKKKKL